MGGPNGRVIPVCNGRTGRRRRARVDRLWVLERALSLALTVVRILVNRRCRW